MNNDTTRLTLFFEISETGWEKSDLPTIKLQIRVTNQQDTIMILIGLTAELYIERDQKLLNVYTVPVGHTLTQRDSTTIYTGRFRLDYDNIFAIEEDRLTNDEKADARLKLRLHSTMLAPQQGTPPLNLRPIHESQDVALKISRSDWLDEVWGAKKSIIEIKTESKAKLEELKRIYSSKTLDDLIDELHEREHSRQKQPP